MKKALGVLAIIFLSSMAAQAETDGGMMGDKMMGGGMMHEEQVEGTQQSQAATLGAQIFGDNCNSCHFNGGNIETPNMPLKGSRMLTDFNSFLNFIRNPKLPDGSQGDMPAFTKSQISDPQAEKLYQFISATYGSGKSGQ